ncbi:MAG: hypothetical protein IH827_04265 [Myxococcales bacterium]|nr:hypothetical protein [Myxococcales bacterium]
MRRTIVGILFSLVLATPAAAAHLPEVSLEDLTLLARSDISDETILVFLDPREIGFELDADAIARLREQGVSDEVIRYLLERTDARSERDDRVVYVSAGAYPPRYYAPYYGYGVFPYFGAAILWHWTHGYHWVDHHLVGGHHLGVSVGHSASHGARHHASAGHLVGGHRSRGHSSGRHAAVSHLGSHGASHAGVGHSGRGHGGGGHSGGGHGGGGHGGGGHGGGGHGGGGHGGGGHGGGGH